MPGGTSRNTLVFINVPFDERYERLYIALIASLTGLGLTPRCVLEIPPSKNRLDRLFGLIRTCGASVHELSRVQLSSTSPRCPRFNMPFEAGLAYAWFSLNRHRHYPVVLERMPYRLQKSLSDLNGIDPFIHRGTAEGMINAISDAFIRRNQPSSDDLLRAYQELRVIASSLRAENRWTTLYRPNAFKKLVFAGQLVARELNLAA